MNNHSPQENKMGTMPIGKLIPAGSGLMAYRDYQPGITPETRLTDAAVEAELE